MIEIRFHDGSPSIEVDDVRAEKLRQMRARGIVAARVDGKAYQLNNMIISTGPRKKTVTMTNMGRASIMDDTPRVSDPEWPVRIKRQFKTKDKRYTQKKDNKFIFSLKELDEKYDIK